MNERINQLIDFSINIIKIGREATWANGINFSSRFIIIHKFFFLSLLFFLTTNDAAIFFFFLSYFTSPLRFL